MGRGMNRTMIYAGLGTIVWLLAALFVRVAGPDLFDAWRPGLIVLFVAWLLLGVGIVVAMSRAMETERRKIAGSGGLGNIRAFVQLTDDVGTSGQPQRAQFELIAKEGYAAVVNLALPTSDDAIADEGSVVTRLGMRYVHIPVDFKNPTLEDVRTFFGTMNALTGRKVWVHCVVNARVSAFMYLYLKHVRGLDDAAARSPVLDRWAPRMEPVWASFIALDRESIDV